MFTFIFKHNDGRVEVVKADNVQKAWENLEYKMGSLLGWKLHGSQG